VSHNLYFASASLSPPQLQGYLRKPWACGYTCEQWPLLLATSHTEHKRTHSPPAMCAHDPHRLSGHPSPTDSLLGWMLAQFLLLPLA
jgi:hypothetical protein